MFVPDGRDGLGDAVEQADRAAETIEGRDFSFVFDDVTEPVLTVVDGAPEPLGIGVAKVLRML
jgi:hypothetical protein